MKRCASQLCPKVTEYKWPLFLEILASSIKITDACVPENLKSLMWKGSKWSTT
jgi:hypothetical protein